MNQDTRKTPQTIADWAAGQNKQQVAQLARLSQAEYAALEKQVFNKLAPYNDSTHGSLGVKAGAELVLRCLRQGFVLDN